MVLSADSAPTLHARFTDRRLKEEGPGGFSFGAKRNPAARRSNTALRSSEAAKASGEDHAQAVGTAPIRTGSGGQLWSRDAAHMLLEEVKEWKRAAVLPSPEKGWQHRQQQQQQLRRASTSMGNRATSRSPTHSLSRSSTSQQAGKNGAFPLFKSNSAAELQDQLRHHHQHGHHYGEAVPAMTAQQKEVVELRDWMKLHAEAIGLVGERPPPAKPKAGPTKKKRRELLQCIGSVINSSHGASADQTTASASPGGGRLSPLSPPKGRRMEDERAQHLMELRKILVLPTTSPMSSMAMPPGQPHVPLADVPWGPSSNSLQSKVMRPPVKVSPWNLGFRVKPRVMLAPVVIQPSPETLSARDLNLFLCSSIFLPLFISVSSVSATYHATHPPQHHAWQKMDFTIATRPLAGNPEGRKQQQGLLSIGTMRSDSNPWPSSMRHHKHARTPQ